MTASINPHVYFKQFKFKIFKKKFNFCRKEILTQIIFVINLEAEELKFSDGKLLVSQILKFYNSTVVVLKKPNFHELIIQRKHQTTIK